MKRFAISAVRVYALCVSPFFAGTCRFTPTCSAYMQTAIERFGVRKGVMLGLKRLSKCHPWYKTETLVDPVPEGD